MTLSQTDRAELDGLKIKLDRALSSDDANTLTDAEVDRLGELRAKERAGIVAAARQRQQRDALRGVNRIALALQRAQRRP